MKLRAVFGFLVLISMASWSVSSRSQDAVIVITWARLMPSPSQPDLKSKSFLSAARPQQFGSEPSAVPTPADPEAPWLSQKRQQPGAGEAASVVRELDGKRVRLGGYVVPLEFDATHIKEFLLVPFVGACIHVPPPPPNQIVYVKAQNTFSVKGAFDPVYVTGVLKSTTVHTGLAETGYTLDAEQVELRPEG